MEKLKGIGAAPGIAIGVAVVRASDPAAAIGGIAARPQEEVDRLAAAIERSKEQLREMVARVAREVGRREAALFRAHLALLDDPMLIGPVRDHILNRGLSAEEAVRLAFGAVVRRFQNLKDGYLRQRAADLEDVGNRLIGSLAKAPAQPATPSESILCARQLTLSEVVLIDPDRTVGILAEEGGRTSHAAVLARALGIPAVVGLAGGLRQIRDGDVLILEGGTGEVIVRPDAEAIACWRGRWTEHQGRRARLTAARHAPAVTRDGSRLEVAASVASLAEVPAALAAGAEGIGLLRTEFLFLKREEFPSEEEQVAAYREALSRMAPRRVVIRTADLGGDKAVRGPDLARDPIPTFGLRGIRHSLRKEERFRLQLRALLRASGAGNLAVLLPMVTSLGEVRRTKELIADCRRELGQTDEEVHGVSLGVMVETPAAAVMAEDLAAEVDFLSIGTNDLTQYVLAVDRSDAEADDLYQPFHPAVLRLIAGTVEAARRRGRWVGVCGEMAADPLAVPLLVGMGVAGVSVALDAVPAVKDTVASVRKSEAAVLVRDVLGLPEHGQIVQRLQAFNDEIRERARPVREGH